MRRLKLVLAALVLLCCVVFMAAGYHIGRNASKDEGVTMVNKFLKGDATFCQLSEGDRFIACLAFRKWRPIPGGGEVTAYACDMLGTYGFMEIRGLSDSRKAQLLLILELQGALTKKVCNSERGETYKVMNVPGSGSQEPSKPSA